MLMNTFMLTLKTPSLHGINSECGAKEVNIKVSTDFILVRHIPVHVILKRLKIDEILSQFEIHCPGLDQEILW